MVDEARPARLAIGDPDDPNTVPDWRPETLEHVARCMLQVKELVLSVGCVLGGRTAGNPRAVRRDIGTEGALLLGNLTT
jgi:hypothetical protein